MLKDPQELVEYHRQLDEVEKGMDATLNITANKIKRIRIISTIV